MWHSSDVVFLLGLAAEEITTPTGLVTRNSSHAPLKGRLPGTMRDSASGHAHSDFLCCSFPFLRPPHPEEIEAPPRKAPFSQSEGWFRAQAGTCQSPLIWSPSARLTVGEGAARGGAVRPPLPHRRAGLALRGILSAAHSRPHRPRSGPPMAPGGMLGRPGRRRTLTGRSPRGAPQGLH